MLLHEAFGDHQVANVTDRGRGAHDRRVASRRPALDPGRHSDVNPYFGIPHDRARIPFDGSALVVWDSGIADAADHEHAAARQGQDPHSHPRSTPMARRQKSEFLRSDGSVIDVCGGAPCVP